MPPPVTVSAAIAVPAEDTAMSAAQAAADNTFITFTSELLFLQY